VGGEIAPRGRAALEILLTAAEAATEDGGGEDGAEDNGTEDNGTEGDGEDPFPELLAEWARFYGPFDPRLPGRLFGIPGKRLEEAWEALVEAQTVVLDVLRQGSEAVEACDTENLETLLRWSRAAARPSFEALPIADLPLFLATFQGLTARGEALDDLRRRLEQLLGFPAPAGLWEGEILPARFEPYYPAWLDSLYQESDLFWLGVGPERLTFAFPGDLDLLAAPTAETPATEGAEGAGGDEAAPGGSLAAARALFPDPRGRFDLAALSRHARLSMGELGNRLWELAWAGRLTTDSFMAVRRGILARFKPMIEGDRHRSPASGRTGRRRADRWRPGAAQAGAWSLLEPPSPAGDALEATELAADRARLLLARYGVLFREILARELPAFAWGEIFRALRRMELSGEILSGHFFAGIPGPQFASHGAFRLLREGLARDASFWLSALDPASPCGLDLPDLKPHLPRRHASTHLAFSGSRPVVVSTRGGKQLRISVPPDHPRLSEYLGFLKVLLSRGFAPVSSVEIETINGEPAAASPYRAVLEEHFGLTRDPKGVRLWKRY